MGCFNGEDIICIIFDCLEIVVFLVCKFWYYYVSVFVDEGIVCELSKLYYESDYYIEIFLCVMFSFDWFYEECFWVG